MAQNSNEHDQKTYQDQCVFKNFIGQDINYYPPEQIEAFQDKMLKATNYFGAIHGIILIMMIAYVIFSIWIKSRFSFYKWVQLAQLISMNILEVLYFFTFNEANMIKNCGFMQLMYQGLIIFLFYQTCMMISWQGQAFFREVDQFIRNGVLISKKKKKKVNNAMFVIWLLAFLQWVIFSLINIICTFKRQYKVLWYYRYGENIFVSVWIMIATFFTAVGYRRIYKLKNLVGKSDLNGGVLQR